MRAREFITENSDPNSNTLADEQASAIKGALTIPDLSYNSSNGSPYLSWRFGVAMAGAPDYPTEPVGPIGGDPLLSTYTDVELDIINKAAKSVGAGRVKKLSSNRSTEMDNVQKVSPINSFRGYKK